MTLDDVGPLLVFGRMPTWAGPFVGLWDNANEGWSPSLVLGVCDCSHAVMLSVMSWLYVIIARHALNFFFSIVLFNNNNNNIALWSGMTNAVLQVSGSF